jgi:predicted alpha/beta superfamily hydrolase
MPQNSLGIRLLRLLVACSACSVARTSAAADATPDNRPASGVLQQRSFKSTTFGDSQTVRIWLPPGYSDPANAQRQYSVLYMLDGQGLFEAGGSSNSGSGLVDKTLTKLIGDGSVEPIVVVGIDTPGDRRSDEYIPYADPVLNPGMPEPHGKMFPSFLATEVLPLVSREFRVSHDRAHVAIGGASYGAVAALFALLQRPDLFGLGLLESTSLQVGNGQLLRDSSTLARGPRRVYIGVGTDEIVGHEDMAKALGLDVSVFDRGVVQLDEDLASSFEASALNHTEVLLVKQPGGRHEGKYWAERFPAAIRFLFPKINNP